MAGGLLGIGINSLTAYQAAITTTAQNLSNATTPFYSQRQVNFGELPFNDGVSVASVSRLFDEAASEDYINKTSASSQYTTYYNALSDFETTLDDDRTNISKYLQDVVNATSKLTSTVGSVQSRTDFMSGISALSNRINAMNKDIASRIGNLNTSIQSTVQDVNSLVTQIGKINQLISQQASDSRPDLLDQREQMVNQLAQYMNVIAEPQANDGLNLALPGGIELIEGQKVFPLSAFYDGQDATQLHLGISDGFGGTVDVSTIITEGSLGAMTTLKQNSYDAASRGIGRIALTLADLFNQQNKLGADLYGNLGGNIFNDINSSSLMSGRVSADTDNGGSGTFSVSVDDASQLVLSDYQLMFGSGNTYSIIRNSDGALSTSGTIGSTPANISFDGLTLTVASGTFNSGDQYLIRPYEGASESCSVVMTDPKKLALAFPVSAAPNLSNLGNGKINVDSIVDTTNAAFATPKQLSPPINVQFLTATSYQLVNANTSAVIEGPITYDPNADNDIFPTPGTYDPGYRVGLTGTISAGDSFSITYNTNTTADGRNANIMSKLYTQPIMDGNSTTLNQAYIAVSLGISLQTKTANTEQQSATTLMNQAKARYYSVSGVDSMTELTNMMNYQQSYQASAQIIQSARTIFETLLGMMR